MKMYTPDGLRLYIDPVYCCAILNRMSTLASPLKVLRLTEDYTYLMATIALVSTCICAATQSKPTTYAISIFISCMSLSVMHLSWALFIPIGTLLRLTRLLHPATALFLVLPICVLIAYFAGGSSAAIWTMIARVGSIILTYVLECSKGLLFPSNDRQLGDVDRSFFYAVRSISPDIDLTDVVPEAAVAERVLEDIGRENPSLAYRIRTSN